MARGYVGSAGEGANPQPAHTPPYARYLHTVRGSEGPRFIFTCAGDHLSVYPDGRAPHCTCAQYRKRGHCPLTSAAITIVVNHYRALARAASPADLRDADRYFALHQHHLSIAERMQWAAVGDAIAAIFAAASDAA